MQPILDGSPANRKPSHGGANAPNRLISINP
jgi:hypothetical protein